MMMMFVDYIFFQKRGRIVVCTQRFQIDVKLFFFNIRLNHISISTYNWFLLRLQGEGKFFVYNKPNLNHPSDREGEVVYPRKKIHIPTLNKREMNYSHKPDA